MLFEHAASTHKMRIPTTRQSQIARLKPKTTKSAVVRIPNQNNEATVGSYAWRVVGAHVSLPLAMTVKKPQSFALILGSWRCGPLRGRLLQFLPSVISCSRMAPVIFLVVVLTVSSDALEHGGREPLDEI